ncbi:hypothetical protein MmiHf6_03180 [Methanimicrococcus hongohii]|uniref:TiaS-like TCKD domain-containing protein n=1 Tax=Methanimicrococcus hongohii TaxID=3028295 RepID=A0AA96UYL9_9EURY|nr:methanogenesis marker protein 11 [Methanimicrococcus sp. Hf6]WNY23022.1 hypothetical protein MmiHf6_03180 [Methanimicrococcus sp. Hf6]
MEDPYTVPYKGIYAICDEDGKKAEIIEHSNCYGGACWSLHHYAKSPAVTNARAVGECIRYSVKIGPSTLELKSSVAAAGIESVICDDSKNEVQITYMGIGGGGIGATKCRAYADGVLRYDISEAGGGKTATGKIFVPKRKRVLIAIDDTDSCDEGATWTLTHNIGKAVSCEDAVYLSQALVQLYPVPEKTQNCMSTVLEFGCTTDAAKEKLIADIKELLLKYSVSENTGMLVYSGFEITDDLKEYSHLGRTMRVSREKMLETAQKNHVDIILDGNGVIGAMAAFAWFAQPVESVKPEFDVNSI